MKVERRKHPRYIVKNGAIEVHTRQSKIIGKLEDISKCGLAFRYTPVQDEKVNSETVDIMDTGPARFYLSGFVCRLVRDIPTLSEDQNFTGNETHLCGMEFVKFEMEENLEFFLNNYLNTVD